MKTIKVLNIKSRPYFFNGMTNIKNFGLNLLSINKTSFEENTNCVIYEIEYFKNLDSKSSL